MFWNFLPTQGALITEAKFGSSAANCQSDQGVTERRYFLNEKPDGKDLRRRLFGLGSWF